MKIWKILMALSIVLYLSSCSEDGLMDGSVSDSIEKDLALITEKNNYQDSLEFIRTYLEGQTYESKSIDEIQNKYGGLRYEHLNMYASEGNSIYVIPLFKENAKEIKALIFIRRTANNELFSFLGSNQDVTKYLSNKNWRSEFINLQGLVVEKFFYDKILFNRVDKKLQQWINKNIIKKNNVTRSYKTCDWVEVCVEGCLYTESLNSDINLKFRHKSQMRRRLLL